MAVLITKSADVNLTDANGFNTIEGGSSASQTTRNNNTNTTTSYVYSSAFTGTNLNVCDGLLLFCNRLNTTGTVSVALSEDNGTTATREVTVNASDLPTSPGWVFFKFGSSLTLDGGTDYKVGVKASSAGNSTFYRDGTAGNWTRRLRLTATVTAGAGDVIYIVGEHTGAGTTNTRTVTMDQTVTTDYGTGTDGTADNGIEVGDSGVLTYGASAATNYYLKLSGTLNVWANGTLNIGTTGAPIPRDSTAVIEFDPVADGGMGLIANSGSYVNIQGLSRASGKNVVIAKLSANAASGTSSLTVDTDTGWLSGDNIVIAKTARSSSVQTESKLLNGNAGASSISLTATLSNNHSGTSPTQAHIGLLTRNIKFRSATSTLMTFFNAKDTATVDVDWAEFYYLGHTTTGTRGIEVETTTGSFAFSYSSIHDTENWAVITVGSSTNNITFSNNVYYNLNTLKASNIHCFQISATSGTASVYSYNYFFACSSNNSTLFVFNAADLGNTITNLMVEDTITGNSVGLNEANATINTISDIETYCSGASEVMRLNANGINGTITNLKGWFHSSTGLTFGNSVNDLTFVSPILFGNQNTNINFGSGGYSNLTFNNAILAGHSSASTSAGITFGSSGSSNIVFNNCNIGIASGNCVAHTNDITCSLPVITDSLFYNCNFGSPTLVANQSNMTAVSKIRFQKHNQTENNHLWYTKYGIARSTGAGLTDTTIRTSGSMGVRIAPADTTTGFTWSFNISAPASSIVNFFGYFQKNAAFGTDTAKVDLYLPGSLTPDATQTLSNTTGSWQAVSISANYTGTVDGLATVIVTAKTTTSSAYIYCDDFFNADTSKPAKIAALDVWYYGMPSPVIVSQAVNAGDVWSYDTTNLTTSNTTGNQVKKLLTVAKFLGLK